MRSPFPGIEPYLEATGGWARSFGTCARKVFRIE